MFTRRLGPTQSVGFLVMIASASALGCGKGYQPVHGKVTLDDGTPVTKAIVVFESVDAEHAVSARGDVQSDGSFKLSTEKSGDGVPIGKYRVLVSPRIENPDSPSRPAFDKKYCDFKTSGLEFEVKSGVTDYQIQLSKAGHGTR